VPAAQPDHDVQSGFGDRGHPGGRGLTVPGLSRRHALLRGAVAIGGLVLSLTSAVPSSAQATDSSDDAPSSEPGSSTAPAAGSATAPGQSPLDAAPPASTAVFAPTDADADLDAEPEDQAEPVASGPWGVPPMKLSMPSLGVEAPIVPVGQDPDGAMAAPTDPDTVAWYEYGPGMGVSGNVVLAGHINWAGRVRTFGNLHLLEPGDAILVIDEKNNGYQYVVESSHWVRAEGAPVEEIFSQTDQPTLTLITCGGEYVSATHEYLDRLIVRAKGA
jgi:LPXTG-site transpeptidase (sortase) family protein